MTTIFNYYFSFDEESLKSIHDEIKTLKIKEWFKDYDINLIKTAHGFFIKSSEMIFMKEWEGGLSIGIYKEPYRNNDVWDIPVMPESIDIFTHTK